MSFQAMAWAVKQKVGNATGKAILLMLANYADERGECFPSQETLASECECSKRSVLDWLQKFEDMGILTRERRHGTGGYRRADLLRLCLGAVNSRENISGENPSKPKCRTFTAEPITEPITSSLRSDVSVKPDFETEFERQFWPSYPRRVGKGQALKAFRAARKKSDLETILAGVRRYADERRGENPEFTKHASTWLNGQCWLDEPPPKFSPSRASPLPKRGETATDIWRDDLIERGILRDEPDSHQSDILDAGYGGRHFESNVHPLRLAFSGSK